MKLIILAAGFGSRLSPATESTPKALLKVDGDKTLLDKQLEAAKACNITEICIVAGFKVEKIEEKIKERADLGISISVVYNPFFRTYNNLVSLWTAFSFMTDNFIMLNGDNIFKPSVLKTLKEESERLENNILVAIHKKSVYDDDDTKIVLNDLNHITQISKDIPYENISAEWIGVCAVCGTSVEAFKSKINQIIRIPNMLDGSPHYLSVFQGLANEGYCIDTIEIPSNSWGEIDFLPDLEYVKNHITRFND